MPQLLDQTIEDFIVFKVSLGSIPHFYYYTGSIWGLLAHIFFGVFGGLGWLADWFVFPQSDKIYLKKKENIKNEKCPTSDPLWWLLCFWGSSRCSAGWSLVQSWQTLTVPLEMVASEKFYCSKEGRCCGEKEGLALGTSTLVTACRSNNSNANLGIGVGTHSGINQPFSWFSACIYELFQGKQCLLQPVSPVCGFLAPSWVSPSCIRTRYKVSCVSFGHLLPNTVPTLEWNIIQPWVHLCDEYSFHR